MRKLFTFLCAALMSAGMFALTPLSGDTWNDDSKTLTVNSNPGYQAYESQAEIVRVIISDGVTSIGDEAFQYCTGMTSVTIGNSVESIGQSAFNGCDGLTSVTIPNSVTSIGNTAFYDCDNLTSVTIGNSVKSIGEWAFDSCTGLTSIEIPNSVTSIEAGAFWGCSGLTSVTNYATTPQTIYSSVFDGVNQSSCTLYVPEESIDLYEDAEVWKEFTIQAIADEPEDVNIRANEDPQHTGVYYSTFYHGSVDYALPANVKAYKAAISGSNLLLSEVAAEGDVLPKGNAVILRSSVQNYTLTPSDATPVSVGDDNDLEGSDDTKATPAKCYVLSCENNLVGFYKYNGTNLNPHKAYVIYEAPNPQSPAPRRMPFIFDATTDVENVQGNVQSTKVLRDGQLFILRDGKTYNAMGQIVK